ncbi:MAG: chemotaxis-specific protein-glutamate methyltransferase CheB [Fibrobacterota bacterium]
MSVRVLVVDDTVTYRKILSEIVDSIDGMELIGTAPNGKIALDKVRALSPSLVLLDINMPVMDGLMALQKIRESFPGTEVVMVSSESGISAVNTIRALRSGAVEFIRKPDSSDNDANREILKKRIEKVLPLVKKKQKQEPENRQEAATPPKITPVIKIKPVKPSILAIGVSTGGPEALHRVVPKLPASFPLPIAVVQHMPPVFTGALAAELNRKSALNVVEASEGEKMEPGKAVIAAGGKHMGIKQEKGAFYCYLSDAPPENSCRPSVDFTFRSLALAAGSRGVLAVIMTGMGNDGALGVKELKKGNCYCITQTESSCVVYGMPRAVDEYGLSDQRVDLDRISLKLIQIAGGGV